MGFSAFYREDGRAAPKSEASPKVQSIAHEVRALFMSGKIWLAFIKRGDTGCGSI